MKKVLFNLVLFAALSFAISSITGCDRDVSNSSAGGTNQAQATSGSSASGESRPRKPSDYPPIATAVAQADIKNFDGTTFKVADRMGKVILLNMWATWCGPCRAEMPALVRLQEQFRDKDLEVIGLNTDDEAVESINSFAQNMDPPLNYQLVWADTKLQKELLKISQFNGIPQSFIIDRDGNLRGVFKGANPADIRKMEELVAKVVNGEESAQPAAAAANAAADVLSDTLSQESPTDANKKLK